MPTQKISPIAELFKDWNIDWSDLIGLVGAIAALLGPFLAWYLNRIGRANIQMLKPHEIQSVEIQKSQANIIYDNQVKSDISKFILPSHEDTLADIRQLAEAVGVEEFEFGDLQILFSPFSTGDTAIGIHDITVLFSISLINAGNRPATVTAIEAEIDDSDREAAQLSHGTIYVNTIFATERAALPLLLDPGKSINFPIDVALKCVPDKKASSKNSPFGQLSTEYLVASEFMDALLKGIVVKISASVWYASTSTIFRSKGNLVQRSFPLEANIQLNSIFPRYKFCFIERALEQAGLLFKELIKRASDITKIQMEERFDRKRDREQRFRTGLRSSASEFFDALLAMCHEHNLTPEFREYPEGIYCALLDADSPWPIAGILQSEPAGVSIHLDLSDEGARYAGVNLERASPDDGLPVHFVNVYKTDLYRPEKAMDVIMHAVIERNARLSKD
jgi:hypothetical protein